MVVIEFKEDFRTDDSLADLRAQPNLLYLTKDRYLIKVWSDSSRMGEQHLAAARRFYEGREELPISREAEDRSIVDMADQPKRSMPSMRMGWPTMSKQWTREKRWRSQSGGQPKRWTQQK